MFVADAESDIPFPASIVLPLYDAPGVIERVAPQFRGVASIWRNAISVSVRFPSLLTSYFEKSTQPSAFTASRTVRFRTGSARAINAAESPTLTVTTPSFVVPHVSGAGVNVSLPNETAEK